MERGRRPHRFGGGRAARYEERRAQRGIERAYAPAWTDAAAAAVLDALHTHSMETQTEMDKGCGGTLRTTGAAQQILSDSSARTLFVQGLDLSAAERGNADHR